MRKIKIKPRRDCKPPFKKKERKMKRMSKEYTVRTAQALLETKSLLEREMKYMEHLRKPDYIKSLKSHIEKLEKMLGITL